MCTILESVLQQQGVNSHSIFPVLSPHFSIITELLLKKKQQSIYLRIKQLLDFILEEGMRMLIQK